MTFDWLTLLIGFLLGAAVAMIPSTWLILKWRQENVALRRKAIEYDEREAEEPTQEVIALPRFGRPSTGTRPYDPRFWSQPMSCAGKCGPLLAGQPVYGLPVLDEDDAIVDTLLICEDCVAVVPE